MDGPRKARKGAKSCTYEEVQTHQSGGRLYSLEPSIFAGSNHAFRVKQNLPNEAISCADPDILTCGEIPSPVREHVFHFLPQRLRQSV
jgi:hypothetical protein